jgi:hypothetical protein
VNAPIKLWRVRYYGDDHDAPMEHLAATASASSAKDIVRRLYPGARIVRCTKVDGGVVR